MSELKSNKLKDEYSFCMELSPSSLIEPKTVEPESVNKLSENCEKNTHSLFEKVLHAKSKASFVPTPGLCDNFPTEGTLNEGQTVSEDKDLSSEIHINFALLADNNLDDPASSPGAASKSDSSVGDSLAGSADMCVYEPMVSLIPYSDYDSEVNENTEIRKKEKGKKRVRNEENWKKNVRKRNRLSGNEYVNTKNVIISKKSIKPPCHDKCRLKCKQRLTEEQRLKIYSEFWDADKCWSSKRQFVLSCIKTKRIARQRKRDGTRRNKTESHTFFFNINNKEEVICKTFFLNTLSISESFMRVALKKVWFRNEPRLITPDLRGKHPPANKLPIENLERIKNHILKFPVREIFGNGERSKRQYLGNQLNISTMYSLYVDECEKEKIKPEKKWIYSKIYNENFNLPLSPSDNGTSAIYDRIDCKIENEKGEEKLSELRSLKENPLEDALCGEELKEEVKLKKKEENS